LQALSVLRDLKVATKMHSQRWDCQGFTGLGLFWWLLSPLLAGASGQKRLFFSQIFRRIRTAISSGIAVPGPILRAWLAISIDNPKKRD
jgi:hypothetical protein